jgi:hypothetical protein
MEQQEQKLASGTSIVPHKFPISLSIVSYIFFTIGLLAALRGFAGLAAAKDGLPLSPLISLILSILYVYISRGMRRCSRGWYVCAVIIAFVAPIWTVGLTFYYFTFPDFSGSGAFPFAFLFIMICIFLIEIWIFQVLTRKDVRALFNQSRNQPT